MARRKRRADRDGVYQRPDSPYWWASVPAPGGRITRRSTGKTTRQEAVQWRSEQIAAAARIDGTASEGYRLREAVDLWLSAKNPSPTSIKRLGSSLAALWPFFGEVDLSQIKGRDIQRYIQARRASVADATIRRELQDLQRITRWTRQRLDWPVPDAVLGHLPPPSKPRLRWYTRAEAAALLAACDDVAPWLGRFARLCLYAGLRPGEALALRWDQINLDRREIVFQPGTDKSKRPSTVPLIPEALAAIRGCIKDRQGDCLIHRDGARVNPGTLKWWFDKAVARAGIEDAHPHDLRRAFGSWLVQDGVSIQAVSRLLRHADITITHRHYAHLADDNLRAAIERLSAPSSRWTHDTDDDTSNGAG